MGFFISRKLDSGKIKNQFKSTLIGVFLLENQNFKPPHTAPICPSLKIQQIALKIQGPQKIRTHQTMYI
jgi:hypothetical protein